MISNTGYSGNISAIIAYLPLAKNTVGLTKTGDINGIVKLTLVDAIYLAKHIGGFIGYEKLY